MHIPATLKKDDLIEGTILSLAFGGEGILRHGGQVIFVPYTAPGDTILCKITEIKKNFARGRIETLLTAGPERTTPFCPYYGTCGGCRLQHISYEAQLRHKQETVRDAFLRIAELPLETAPTITPATLIRAYRRHITLTAKITDKGYRVGYTADDHYTFLPVLQCPIFTDPSNPVIENLQNQLALLDHDGSNEGKIHLLKEDDGTFILHLRFEKLPRNSREVFDRMHLRSPSIAGILLSSRRGEIAIGKTTTFLTVEGLRFEISPAAFVQNHPEQSLNIYKEICTRTLDLAGRPLLDLYCGIGISSLLLAKQKVRVTGIEYNPTAVTLAQRTAKAHAIPAVFIQGDVKFALKKQLSRETPELVIVNPPREGMDAEVLSLLKTSGAKRILYISCMPPTMARDLKQLCENTYGLHDCLLFDMFPQTAHVETLVELRLK